MTVSAESIAAAVKAANSRGLPPVDQWDPPFCGDLNMRIAADGTWFYEGTPIGRHKLVRLFSTILKKEADKYFLVTPVEKVGITVEDVPFLAVDFSVEGDRKEQRLTFQTSVGDSATAGAACPMRFEEVDGQHRPYVEVRAGLEARIDRKSFFRLVDLGDEETIDGIAQFGVWSSGVFFPIAPTDSLS